MNQALLKEKPAMVSARAQAAGVVVQYPNVRAHPSCTHETVPRIAVAKRLAALRGFEFSHHYDAQLHAGSRMYFVPDDTLSCQQARAIGIKTDEDLFGGVVPYPFVATKAVTHPLIDEHAYAPPGWSHELVHRMGNAVLPGYTVFAVDDARRAVKRMLERGPARLKATRGIGGNGQAMVADAAGFERAMAAIDEDELARDGWVIERHLEDITTFSVGHAHVGGLHIAYCGTQRLALNNAGHQVYGGSELQVVRGDFTSLLQEKLPPDMLEAVAQARHYDAAVSAEFPESLVSRRNYDVLRGKDAAGNWQMGVLEQSWRLGGATPAEVAAFEIFKADPGRRRVHAACHEVYGAHVPPAHATIYFDAVDEKVGRIMKYTCVDPNENPA